MLYSINSGRSFGLNISDYDIIFILSGYGFGLSRLVVWLCWPSQYVITWALTATWSKLVLNRAIVLKPELKLTSRSFVKCSNANGIGANWIFFLCHYQACFYHHLKLTFCWKRWLWLKLGSYKGFFAFFNCRYFFSFSLLSCIVKNRVGSGFEHVGLPSGKWTEHTLEQFSGSKSALRLDISFTHLFLSISFFGNLCHMTEVTFEDTIDLSGYLQLLSHVPTQQVLCLIYTHCFTVYFY